MSPPPSSQRSEAASPSSLMRLGVKLKKEDSPVAFENLAG